MQRSWFRAAALVAAAALLTGCAAGQLAQTAQIVTTVDGAEADVGSVALRDISLAYPVSGEHSVGSNVRLEFYAVNSDPLQPDNLQSVTSTVFTGGPNAVLPVELPATGTVSFEPGGLIVELQGLSEALLPSVMVPVTFTFERAGTVTVQVPVGVPRTNQPNEVEPFDFNQEQPTVG